MTSRRMVLKAAAGGLAGLSCPPLVRSSRAAGNPGVTRVTAEIAVVTGLGGNVLVRPAGGGQVLVDGGAAEFTDTLLETLDEFPGGRRVGTLFNTHWHLDQVGSNASLGRTGTAIIAHEKTRVHLATDHYLPTEDRYRRALPPEAHPTTSFYTRGETTVDAERIEYGHLLQAHTDGDIYVFFTDSNVVAVGDAVSPVRDPALDWFGGGWLGGRVDSLAMLLEIGDERTRFVPSYGPAVGRAEVQAEHDLMRSLFERTVELLRMGYSAEEMWVEGVMDGLDRSFDDPLKFLYDVHKGLWAHHNTLSHDIV